MANHLNPQFPLVPADVYFLDLSHYWAQIVSVQSHVSHGHLYFCQIPYRHQIRGKKQYFKLHCQLMPSRKGDVSRKECLLSKFDHLQSFWRQTKVLSKSTFSHRLFLGVDQSCCLLLRQFGESLGELESLNVLQALNECDFSLMTVLCLSYFCLQFVAQQRKSAF